ncbi:conserved hypothetical protein [Talaromyces stipitatus ATCC 10500]|uniref:Uncharacterized protein n=1 Tax=Talaromyces stipitatus (strain ATCC 10500 / CBS 375.48 / QM 6759 / NRRL 1006) TaxID=441959 RepID=B8LUY3_TALSN|nr:uncharacterized protein TSTA_060950 [Talaromyces stipitatus ATCC 10500]EED22604.1 conserved hypothetical protein [Talaromyces stipitatus ATCC 10500]
MWAIAHPDNQTKRCYDMYNAIDYLVRAAIESGLTYGVFDKEWMFKRPESAATDGALYWDQTDLIATSEQLLEQIDCPLVSIYFLEIFPLFATMHEHFHTIDKRDPKSWEPTGPGQIIMRTETSTRADYEGMGLMKLMAHWEIKDAAAKGFRGINMETLHLAVDHVWMYPHKTKSDAN